MLLLLALAACSDACEQTCAATTRAVGDCIEDWPVGWDELGAASRQDFRQGCEEDWESLRAGLETREIQQALDQCEDATQELNGLSCDELRVLVVR